MNKKVLSLVLAMAMILGSFSFVAADGFTDVDPEKLDWAVEAIEDLVDREIVEGVGDNRFAPNSSVTRVQFAAMVNRALELEDKADIDFSDVDEGIWYHDHVAMAVEAGYAEGVGEGRFAPNSPISRQDAATMIGRAFELEKSEEEADFTDIEEIRVYAIGFVNTAAAKEFIVGYDDGTFLPDFNITRAQSALIIHRVLVYEENLEVAITAAEAAIEALPSLEDFDVEDEDDLALVEDARALVDAALELDEDAVIEGLEDLEALEDRIEELAEVTAIEEQLLALPDAEEVTAEDEEAIESAREAYDALAEELAERISEEALAQLIGAEAALEALEEDEEPEPTITATARVGLTGLGVTEYIIDLEGADIEDITDVLINGTSRMNASDIIDGEFAVLSGSIATKIEVIVNGQTIEATIE